MPQARYQQEHILQVVIEVWPTGGVWAQRLKTLELENQRLKKMYGELSLEHQVLKDMLKKNFYHHHRLSKLKPLSQFTDRSLRDHRSV